MNAIPQADLSWFDSDANAVEYEFDEDHPDIFQAIIREMRSDDDAQRQTAKFLMFYLGADDAKKEVIDETLTHICGWSLEKLIGLARDQTPDPSTEGSAA